MPNAHRPGWEKIMDTKGLARKRGAQGKVSTKGRSRGGEGGGGEDWGGKKNGSRFEMTKMTTNHMKY